MNEVLWCVTGVVLGAAGGALGAAAWLSRRSRGLRESLGRRAAEAEAALESADRLRSSLDAQTGELDALRTELADARVATATATERAGRVEPLEHEVEHLRERAAAQELELTAQSERTRALQARMEEKEATIADAEKRLGDTFTALSSKALGASSEQFLKLAQQRFERLMANATGDQEKRQEALSSMMKPMQEALAAQQKAIHELEQKRQGAYQNIETLVRSVSEQHRALHQETSRLVTALRRPEQRGRWGEMQLRNAVELAGMTEHCDFTEQVSVDGDDGRLRPDMVVKLPGDGRIVVDSKVALDAFLDALQPDADRDACMRRHAQQVQSHVQQLAQKRYWEQFEKTPKLVVLFMPIESALAAAMDVDPDLHARAMNAHVLIATPTLLVALLRAIGYGWRQEDVAANARAIGSAGKQLYERLGRFAEHLDKVGVHLRRANESYNGAVGSLERQLLPGARRLKELNATDQAELEAPRRVETEPRSITSGELLFDSEVAAPVETDLPDATSLPSDDAPEEPSPPTVEVTAAPVPPRPTHPDEAISAES